MGVRFRFESEIFPPLPKRDVRVSNLELRAAMRERDPVNYDPERSGFRDPFGGAYAQPRQSLKKLSASVEVQRIYRQQEAARLAVQRASLYQIVTRKRDDTAA